MPWAKFDDGLAMHPKFLERTELAKLVYMLSIVHCARELTDGRITPGNARILFAVSGPACLANASAITEELVTAGLWDRHEDDLWVHDYLVYNPSRVTVEENRTKTKDRVSEWRAQKKCNSVTTPVTNGVSNAPCTVSTRIPNPESRIPVPEPNPTPDGVVAPGSARRPTDAPLLTLETVEGVETGHTKDRPSLGVTAGVWAAYASAYCERYGTPPARNARVNGQLAQFVKRLPADDAPAVAAFYVRHQGRWYVQRGHPVECLLKDAESLYTQWQTGHRITAKEAAELDRLDGTGQMWREIAQERRVQNGR